jgi:hypothetical protein
MMIQICYFYSSEIANFFDFDNLCKILDHFIFRPFHVETKEWLGFWVEYAEAVIFQAEVGVVASKNLHQICPLYEMPDFHVNEHHPLEPVLPYHAVLANIFYYTVEDLTLLLVSRIALGIIDGVIDAEFSGVNVQEDIGFGTIYFLLHAL